MKIHTENWERDNPRELHIDSSDPRIVSEQTVAVRNMVRRCAGADFWGIRLPDAHGRVSNKPDRLSYRIQILRKLLADAPHVDTTTAKTAKFNYYDLIKSANRSKQNVIRDPCSGLPAAELDGMQYIEAYKNPLIHLATATALEKVADPVSTIVEELESWRREEAPELSHITMKGQLDLGRQSFEVFVFATGGTMLIPALGAAAIASART